MRTRQLILKGLIVRLLIGAIVLLAVALLMQRALAKEEVRVAQPAPAFALRNLQGKLVRLGDFEGKALVIMFWATWDTRSRDQIPMLQEFRTELGTNGWEAIGISIDSFRVSGPGGFTTDVYDLIEYVRIHEIQIPVLVADLQAIQDFGGLEGIPTFFVIDRNHNLIQKYVGRVEKQKLESDLRMILKD